MASHESNGIPVVSSIPAWYCANGRDEPDSLLTPGAAIALEIAFDAGLDGFNTLGRESDLYEALPARFVRRYDDEFFERFVPALRRVYESAVANSDHMICRCTADEIAFDVLVYLAKNWAIAAVEMNTETPGAFPLASLGDEASLHEFHSQLVTDSDVLFLWDWEDDGIEDDEDRMAVTGIGNALKFENWFVPFEDL